MKKKYTKRYVMESFGAGAFIGILLFVLLLAIVTVLTNDTVKQEQWRELWVCDEWEKTGRCNGLHAYGVGKNNEERCGLRNDLWEKVCVKQHLERRLIK